MTTRQITLTDDSADGTETTDPTATKTTEQKSGSSATDPTLAPPDQRGGDGCCPWCLAATNTFEHREDGRVRCGYCDATIPVGAEWYEQGEKIIV